MPKKSALAFTLVELLIVISIIAVLSAIGFTSYTSFVKSSRDAKRQSDLKFIQSALEQYFADQKYYPQKASGSCPEKGDGLFRNKCSLTNSDGKKIYLNQIPPDPQTSPDYLYTPLPQNCDNTPSNKCLSYCLFAKLEGANPTSDPPCPPASPHTFGITKP